MSKFVYFLPAVTPSQIATSGLLKKELAKAGLQYLGVTRPNEISVVPARPDVRGNPGVVLAIGPEDPKPDEHYVWLDCKSFHVGCQSDQPPGPPDTARPQLCAGYNVTDAAGRDWVVPIARSPIDGNVTLPADFLFDLQTGVATSRVKPEFDWLWELTATLHGHWHGTENLPASQLAAAALKILGVNYRIGAAESNLLQFVGCPVIDHQTTQLITLFCLDNPQLDEQKKKDTTPGDTSQPPDGCSLNPGETEHPHTIDQVAASC